MSSSLVLLVQINDEIRARLNPIGHAYRLLRGRNSSLLSRAACVRIQRQLVFARRQSFERVLSSRAHRRSKLSLTLGAFTLAVSPNNEADVFRRFAVLKFHPPAHDPAP